MNVDLTKEDVDLILVALSKHLYVQRNISKALVPSKKELGTSYGRLCASYSDNIAHLENLMQDLTKVSLNARQTPEGLEQ